MRIRFKLFFALLVISLLPLTLFADSYEEMWQKVKKAQQDGLPQTAIKELEPIYKKAIEEKNQVQALKSICKIITMEGSIQGNLPEERIIRFEKAVETADEKKIETAETADIQKVEKVEKKRPVVEAGESGVFRGKAHGCADAVEVVDNQYFLGVI